MSVENITSLANFYGFNMRLIAAHAGVNRASLYYWLNGRPAPRLEKSIAALFDLSVSDLRKRVGLDQDTTDTNTKGDTHADATDHRILKSGRTRQDRRRNPNL